MGDLLVRWYGRSPFGYVVGIFGLLLFGELAVAAAALALYCRMLGLPGDVFATMLWLTLVALAVGFALYVALTARRELLFRFR